MSSFLLLGAGTDAAVGGGGAGPTWHEAVFNSTAALTSTTTIASLSYQKAMIAFSADLSGCANGTYLFGLAGTTQEISIRILSASPSLRLLYSDGTLSVNVDLSGFNYVTPGGEFIFIATLDTTQATAAAGLLSVVGTTSLTQTVTSWQAANVPFGSLNDLEIGERAGGGLFAGKMKWFWFDAGNLAGAYPDPTLTATQNKFAQGTLLSDGSNVTGAKPLLFFGGPAVTDWTSATNHGAAAGAWTYNATIT